MWWKENTSYFDFLPDLWHSKGVVKVIKGIVDDEIVSIKLEMSNLLDDKFPQTATLKGIQRWENILKLNTPIKDDIEYRRSAILSKLRSKPPINEATLKEIIETYLGVPVELNLYSTPYVITAKYRGISKLPDLTPLYATVRETIPANMKLEISYAYATFDEILATYPTFVQQAVKTFDELVKGV